MNCCSWEWLKYSTVLLFPHDFTRVDHQEENSIILTLRDKIPHDLILAFKLKWPVWLEGIPRVLVAWRHSGDVLLLLLGWLWVLFYALEFLLRSFRLSRVSSEIWLRVGSRFKLGQMLRLGALLEQLQVSRKRAISSREQRASESWESVF